VGENHTIIIIPDPAKQQKISIAMLCRLLNTAAVDARFRRMSGSVSVSTKALNQLPLPTATHVRTLINSGSEGENAAEVAYAELQRLLFARQRSRDLIAELERLLAEYRQRSLFRPPTAHRW